MESCESCKHKAIPGYYYPCCRCDAHSEYVAVDKAVDIRTNADRIRAMSDEELAKFLNRIKEPCNYCQLANVEGACTETLCDDAMMNWLKQPAKQKM